MEAWQYSSSGPGIKLKTPAPPPYEARAARPGSWAKYPGMLNTRVVKKARNPTMPNWDFFYSDYFIADFFRESKKESFAFSVSVKNKATCLYKGQETANWPLQVNRISSNTRFPLSRKFLWAGNCLTVHNPNWMNEWKADWLDFHFVKLSISFQSDSHRICKVRLFTSQLKNPFAKGRFFISKKKKKKLLTIFLFSIFACESPLQRTDRIYLALSYTSVCIL